MRAVLRWTNGWRVADVEYLEERRVVNGEPVMVMVPCSEKPSSLRARSPSHGRKPQIWRTARVDELTLELREKHLF